MRIRSGAHHANSSPHSLAMASLAKPRKKRLPSSRATRLSTSFAGATSSRHVGPNATNAMIAYFRSDAHGLLTAARPMTQGKAGSASSPKCGSARNATLAPASSPLRSRSRSCTASPCPSASIAAACKGPHLSPMCLATRKTGRCSTPEPSAWRAAATTRSAAMRSAGASKASISVMAAVRNAASPPMSPSAAMSSARTPVLPEASRPSASIGAMQVEARSRSNAAYGALVHGRRRGSVSSIASNRNALRKSASHCRGGGAGLPSAAASRKAASMPRQWAATRSKASATSAMV
mmetsp:Transcript_82865/g.230538  ORF Transcript_82865/g.230538 Transcript_82865/m.230538 type:complete len:293 (-) Transcript_82865:98-976(-)